VAVARVADHLATIGGHEDIAGATKLTLLGARVLHGVAVPDREYAVHRLLANSLKVEDVGKGIADGEGLLVESGHGRALRDRDLGLPSRLDPQPVAN